MIRLHVESSALWEEGLAEVSAGDLNGLYSRLLSCGRLHHVGGLSPRTVRYVHALLNKAFSDAVRLGVLAANPAAAADPPSSRSARSPVAAVWSPDELAQFLASAKADPHHDAFHLAAATGLRRSELLGLRWCDVDPQAGQLQVIQGVVQVGHERRITPLKTERSRRLVALDERTTQILALRRAAAEAANPTFRTVDLVFPAEDGGPIRPGTFTYSFGRRVKLAGLRRIRLHDLRHTHATHALQIGVHPKVVSERLGHSSVMVTLDIYSHVLPSLQREAAEAVAALVNGEQPQSTSP